MNNGIKGRKGRAKENKIEKKKEERKTSLWIQIYTLYGYEHRKDMELYTLGYQLCFGEVRVSCKRGYIWGLDIYIYAALFTNLLQRASVTFVV